MQTLPFWKEKIKTDKLYEFRSINHSSRMDAAEEEVSDQKGRRERRERKAMVMAPSNYPGLVP